jgi:hypothetical protein
MYLKGKQMKYISKEESENIKKLNKILGTQHRSKPYNFKNPDDIIYATVMATAEYLDLANYWMTLYEVDESFDESLEHYDTAAWINIGLKGSTERKDIDRALSSLRKTTSVFRELMDTSEEKCTAMWYIVFFSSSSNVREHFFGQLEDYNEATIKKALEKTIENIFEIEYNGNVETSSRNFAMALKDNLDLIKKLPNID